MNDMTALGDRVRTLRLANDLTQTDLARMVGQNKNGLISKIENGRITDVSADLVADLSLALGCTVEFLTTPPPQQLYTRPWLRAYADAPVKTVDAIVASNLLHSEISSTLDLKRMPPADDLDFHDLDNEDAIENFASEVRAAAGIDEGGVVRHAIRAAERLGVVVLPLAGELDRHLGLSHYIDDVAYLRVSRGLCPSGGVPGDRQRFTVAHELGHLFMHRELAPPDSADDSRRIESQAHRFAGAFLTPADPLLEDLDLMGGRPTLNTLMQLKSTWGVSIKMLVVRLRQLGRVEQAHATSLYKQISKRGWNKAEPVTVSNETPVWFEKSLSRRFKMASDPGAHATASAAASAIGLAESHFLAWLDWDTQSATAPVYDLAARRSMLSVDSSAPAESSAGTVTSLGARRT